MVPARRWVEGPRGQAVSEQLGGEQPADSAVFDGMDALAARSQDVVPIYLGSGGNRPGHGPWALAEEPVTGGASSIYRPEVGLRLFRRHRDVWDEAGDRGVLGKVQHLARRRSHANFLPPLHGRGRLPVAL